MAIKPISCGISNINLQMVGKTGQPEQGHGQILRRRQDGEQFTLMCERVSKEGHPPAFLAAPHSQPPED